MGCCQINGEKIRIDISGKSDQVLAHEYEVLTQLKEDIEQEVKALFFFFDDDNLQYLERREMKKYVNHIFYLKKIGLLLQDEYLDVVFKEFDTDNSQKKIDYLEMQKYLTTLLNQIIYLYNEQMQQRQLSTSLRKSFEDTEQTPFASN